MHLALVIHRLTQSGAGSGGGKQHVPYRDSTLTRLLADSFGGSSKTCLIIACSALAKDREETQGSLEFGKRAGLVRNAAQINIEIEEDPSELVKALVANEVAGLKRAHEDLQKDHRKCRRRLRDAASDALCQNKRRVEEARSCEEEKERLRGLWRQSADIASRMQEESAAVISRLQQDNSALQRRLQSTDGELSHVRDTLSGLLQQIGSQRAEAASTGAWQVSSLSEEWKTASAQLLAEKSAALKLAAGEAASKVAKDEECWEARLASLQAEAAELQSRWGEDFSRGSSQDDADDAAMLSDEDDAVQNNASSEVVGDGGNDEASESVMAIRRLEMSLERDEEESTTGSRMAITPDFFLRSPPATDSADVELRTPNHEMPPLPSFVLDRALAALSPGERAVVASCRGSERLINPAWPPPTDDPETSTMQPRTSPMRSIHGDDQGLSNHEMASDSTFLMTEAKSNCTSDLLIEGIASPCRHGLVVERPLFAESEATA